MEIERRQQQLEESTAIIRRLQEELEFARKTASNVRLELHESEYKSRVEAEMTDLRGRNAVLESKLNKVRKYFW